MPERGAGSELFFFAFLAIDVMAAFTQMLAGGVFEKHPKLRCTVLESGATWISAWLDRMDHKYEVMQTVTPTAAQAERVLLPPVPGVGRPRRDRDRPDHRRGRAPTTSCGRRTTPTSTPASAWSSEIRSRLTSLSAEDQAKVLGLNAQRFYNLEVPALV